MAYRSKRKRSIVDLAKDIPNSFRPSIVRTRGQKKLSTPGATASNPLELGDSDW